MVNIREARKEDISSLLMLEQGIINYERPYDALIKESNATYYDIPKLISDPESYVIVMESSEEIIGSGYAQIRDSKTCHIYEKHCYLGFIYLQNKYRGRALGHQILDALKQWGKSKGMRHFQLGVYAENDAAIRAYEKSGFKKMSIVMELVE